MGAGTEGMRGGEDGMKKMCEPTERWPRCGWVSPITAEGGGREGELTKNLFFLQAERVFGNHLPNTVFMAEGNVKDGGFFVDAVPSVAHARYLMPTKKPEVKPAASGRPRLRKVITF